MRHWKLPSYAKILIGMVLGVLLGLLAVSLNLSLFANNWIAPFGEIFIRVLKLVAIPLVLVSLIKGVGSLNDIAKLATIGVKTILIYVTTTICAIAIGIALVTSIKPGSLVSQHTSQSITQHYSSNMESNMSNMEELQGRSPLQSIVDIFPSNAVEAMGDNSSMLQIILIASLIGVAIIMVGKEKSAPFMAFIESLDSIILKCIDIIMSYAPIGVASLMAMLVVDNAGDLSLLSALGMYGLTVILGLFTLIFIFYPLLVKLFSNVKVSKFFKAMIPVQIMGFSTSSSAATLATTMKVANEDLKLPKEVTSFTLPVGVTINMDGTSCYQAIAIIFIAQVMDIDLTFSQILIIIGTTTLSSIGAPAVPGGSIVVSMMVLSSIGIPPEGLALILGIDRPLDMIRTAVNITGDVTISSIISKSYTKG